MVDKLSLIGDWIRQQNRNRRVVLTVLAAMVVFVTTYLLILPAVTLDEDEAAQQGGIDVNVEEPAADESATGELVADEPATDVSEQAGAPGDAAAATTISDGGKTYGVSVTCGEAAEVPANAALEVTEITRKHEGYDALLAGAEQALGKGADIAFARFFDIRIVDENGDKVEIAAPVDVRI